MPFVRAFFTLSRVIDPTTRLGKRYFRETKRFRTAVCKGLSVDVDQNGVGVHKLDVNIPVYA